MAIPSRVLSHLQEQGINYELIPLAPAHSFLEAAERAGVPQEQLVRTVLLEAGGDLLMALLPASHLLDFSTLATSLRQDLSLANDGRLERVFQGCDPGCRSPLPELFNMQAVVDTSLLGGESVYIEPGSRDCLLKLKQADFTQLMRRARPGQFSVSGERLRLGSGAQGERKLEGSVSQLTPLRMRQRVEETFDLPAMPEVAQQVMRLRVDPNATTADLAAIVNRDPSLSAQVISWASSPFYGYQGTIRSVEDAIARVLGFDLVMNLALGIAVGKSLKVSHDGPLGLRAFWRQSIYTAVLAERLTRQIPAKIRPQRGLVYLAGLLHNFGHLLLGHVFPPQFFLINRYVEINPQLPVASIESHVLGVNYQEIGAWLMQAWHMPEELVETVRWHHQEEFSSKAAAYSNVVLLACRLLARQGLSDHRSTTLPTAVLEFLGLTASQVETVYEEVMTQAPELDTISRQMAA
ncbi:MAG: HDOD domain-containing protein [Gammaproteobacteria bacterium]|nr:HDOD domain-containing protein [Gammaproteobacteria bacterium]